MIGKHFFAASLEHWIFVRCLPFLWIAFSLWYALSALLHEGALYDKSDIVFGFSQALVGLSYGWCFEMLYQEKRKNISRFWKIMNYSIMFSALIGGLTGLIFGT